MCVRSLFTHRPRVTVCIGLASVIIPHFADERKSRLYGWEGNLRLGDEETKTQRSQATCPRSHSSWSSGSWDWTPRPLALDLGSLSLGLFSYENKLTPGFLDFWADVLWLSGAWPWLSQGPGVAEKSCVAGTGSGLWGGDVTRGEGLWVCVGAERWALLPGNQSHTAPVT